ncbi:hypothetical protein [Nonomuraea fuscirosea]|nr:hypothetical protein [Nonomuraea fuscirosea]
MRSDSLRYDEWNYLERPEVDLLGGVDAHTLLDEERCGEVAGVGARRGD